MTRSSNTNADALGSYYRWHAPFYDISRWSFLFGRNNIITRLPSLPHHASILEVGCGTGRNIALLQKQFPTSKITGIDCSECMLGFARSKHQSTESKLLQGVYGKHEVINQKFDLILLSYTLTMMQQPFEQTIEKLASDLEENGVIAVVDFHHTPYNWFHYWMKQNHVTMDKTLLGLLQNRFEPIHIEVKPAYLGWWWYFSFIGKKE